MDRIVPFDEDETCDICGEVGAFDFMGDLLCAECVVKLNKRNTKDEQKAPKNNPKRARGHRAPDGRNGRPEDI